VGTSAPRDRRWTIVAIARHLGSDGARARAHLKADREEKVRQRSRPDRLGPLVVHHLQGRFADDAHIWATAVYDEVVGLGCPSANPSFVRKLG
jgi:hypothetical protein